MNPQLSLSLSLPIYRRFLFRKAKPTEDGGATDNGRIYCSPGRGQLHTTHCSDPLMHTGFGETGIAGKIRVLAASVLALRLVTDRRP